MTNTAPLSRHRFAVETADFTTATGDTMTNYSILMYGTSAADATARALNVITARFSPTETPTVTSTRCDMGCIDKDHA